MSSDRAARSRRNLRLALVLAAVAAAFYVAIELRWSGWF